MSQAIKANNCIGIDDGPFLPKKLGGSRAPLVIVKLEGPHLTKVRTGWVEVDGLDATKRALRLLSALKVSDSPILLAGATYAGFNLINPHTILRQFRTPTIVVVRSKPNNGAVKRALVRHFVDWKERWEIIRALGPLHSLKTVKSENPIFYEKFGCSNTTARKILSSWALVSRIPEPLRVAGLVARGLFASQPANKARGYRRL